MDSCMVSTFYTVEYYQHNHFHQRGNYDLINFRRMTPQEPHSSQFFPSMAASMVFSLTFTSILQVDRNHPHQHQNGIQVEPRPLWLALIRSRSISWTCPSLHGQSPTSQGDTNDCQKINIISPGTNTLLRNMWKKMPLRILGVLLWLKRLLRLVMQGDSFVVYCQKCHILSNVMYCQKCHVLSHLIFVTSTTLAKISYNEEMLL